MIAVDDTLAVFVIFVNIKINDVTHVDDFLIPFEISARLAHDDCFAVINKVESPYTFDNSSCHMRSVPLAVVVFAVFIFIFVFVAAVIIAAVIIGDFRLFRLRLRSGAYLQVYRRALIKL